MSVSGHQLKARVFEVMHSGAMLLEERNDQIAAYFTEDLDYVAFSNEKEMLEKIQYYLQHDEERLAIARNGYLKVRTNFTGKQFWRMVLN
jgi:spore maturation protein CgeB